MIIKYYTQFILYFVFFFPFFFLFNIFVAAAAGRVAVPSGLRRQEGAPKGGRLPTVVCAESLNCEITKKTIFGKYFLEHCILNHRWNPGEVKKLIEMLSDLYSHSFSLSFSFVQFFKYNVETIHITLFDGPIRSVRDLRRPRQIWNNLACRTSFVWHVCDLIVLNQFFVIWFSSNKGTYFPFFLECLLFMQYTNWHFVSLFFLRSFLYFPPRFYITFFTENLIVYIFFCFCILNHSYILGLVRWFHSAILSEYTQISGGFFLIKTGVSI